MRRKKVDVKLERQVCIGFIMDQGFTMKLSPHYQPDYILSAYIREIIGWCIEFYAEFGDVPRLHIQDIFHNKKSQLDDDLLDQLEDFLDELSEEYVHGSINFEFLFKQSFEYFKRRSLKVMVEDVNVHLKNGNDTEAFATFDSFTLPNEDVDTDSVVNPFEDMGAVKEAFEENAEPLFRYRGAFGEMFNEFACKGNLIGIMAPEKSGKTFLLVDIAKKGLSWGNSVAFIGAGDMSRKQMIRRFFISIAGKSDKMKYCGNVRVPVSAEHIEEEDGDNYIDVEFMTEIIKKPLTWKEGWKKAQRFRRFMREGKFKLACFPTDSINVTMIKSLLRKWKKEEGFEADVVLIDYGDILAAEPGISEYRHQQNKTWKLLRNLSLSQELGEPLVIVPTQSDAESYGAGTLKRKNFSEDKRKYAHVTGMLAINQTEEEKEQQAARLSWVLLREGEFSESKCCTILQCLSKGRFILQSFWKSTEENDK